MLYNELIDKIIEIFEEDKNKPEGLLRYDLNRVLNDEITQHRNEGYNMGYEDCKRDYEDRYC